MKPSDQAARPAATLSHVPPPPLPRPIPPDRLRAMSEHVLYEIEMFADTTDLLTPEIWADVPRFMATGAHNAFIEAFTVHARALHDFLYAKPWGDDASAADWFPGAEAKWYGLRGPEPEIPKEARQRTGKEIAHITYVRLEREGDGKLWPHREIVEALRTPLFRFIDHVDRDLVCDRFVSAAWQAVLMAASVPLRGRAGEPGVLHDPARRDFGMPVATQAVQGPA